MGGEVRITDILGTMLAFVLVINFIVEGNIHAALGWGAAPVLFSNNLRKAI